MKKAGGITALVAGIFGVLSAMATLFIGGIGSAFGAEGVGTVVGLGWGGMGFSFLTVILASIALSGQRSMVPGILLIVGALAGTILGGTLVAVFMVLAAVGGVLVVLGSKRERLQRKPALTQPAIAGMWQGTAANGVVAPGQGQSMAPGWYSDPNDPAAVIWWDGRHCVSDGRILSRFRRSNVEPRCCV